MHYLDNTPGRTCLIEGKEFLFFSGYGYLGMNHVDEFTGMVIEGINKYGVLFPSSRISNTRLAIYDDLENELSQLTGAEATITFSSGFLAGQTIAQLLGVEMFVAPGTHPAIRIFTEEISKEEFHEWSARITNIINDIDDPEAVIALDSINIMNSTINDFSFLKEIDHNKKLTVLIDDSHGIGILGDLGEGIVSKLPRQDNIEYIISYSLSKGFGVPGGAVSCSRLWAAKIRQHPGYTASTSISPALIYAFIQSWDLHSKQRKILRENIAYLKSKSSPTFQNSFDLPVFITSLVQKQFYDEGIIISSFAYPYPESGHVNRVVVNALHTKEDLDKLLF